MGEKGKKKSRILLIVCGLLLLAGAIIGIVMFRMQAGASAYNESIKTAEKYADSGEYELAVLTYENAIKDRPKEEEGYLGLADVYLKRGESSAAKVLLQRGYMHTNSSKIQYMLSGIKDGSLLAEFDDSETKKETMQSFGVFSFNTAFLQKLENYDYTDYCDQFGSYPQIVKTGKGEVEVVHKDLAGTCCYSNTKEHDDIVNVKTDKPAKDGMPEIVRLDSISQLFRNFPGKASLAELNAISSSKVAPITDEERVYVELSTGKIILITSASGGVGKTSVAFGLCRCLERNYKKTLYVNADRLQSFQWMLENGEPIRDASVYAGLSGNLGNVYRIVRHVIRKEGFSYLPPFKAALMSLGIPYRVFALLAEAARKEQEYDYIVIDADSVFDEEKAALMQLADKILIVTKQTEYAVKATNELIQNVNRNNSDKYIFLCNDFKKEEENALLLPTAAHRFTVSEYIEHLPAYEMKGSGLPVQTPGLQKAAFLIM